MKYFAVAVVVLMFVGIIVFAFVYKTKMKNKVVTHTPPPYQFPPLSAETIAKIESALAPLMKTAHEILAYSPEQAAELGRPTSSESHFGGLPYAESGFTWPRNAAGEPLEFVFEIKNDGIILPPEIALIQFFYDFELSPWKSGEDGAKTVIYKTLDPNLAVIPESPIEEPTVNYCPIAYTAVKQLPALQDLDKHCEEASELLNGDYMEYERITLRLTEKLNKREICDTSYFGSYPQWIQNNDEDQVSGEFLMTIASEDCANLMWGDDGNIYFYYDKASGKVEFILQCY